MRKLLVWIVLMVGLSTPAWADALTFTWIPSAGATSYKLYQSADLGVTWTVVVTVGAPPAVVNVPTDKLYLFRVSAINTAGEAVQQSKGAWYNGLWDTAPRSMALQ